MKPKPYFDILHEGDPERTEELCIFFVPKRCRKYIHSGIYLFAKHEDGTYMYSTEVIEAIKEAVLYTKTEREG